MDALGLIHPEAGKARIALARLDGLGVVAVDVDHVACRVVATELLGARQAVARRLAAPGDRATGSIGAHPALADRDPAIGALDGHDDVQDAATRIECGLSLLDDPGRAFDERSDGEHRHQRGHEGSQSNTDARVWRPPPSALSGCASHGLDQRFAGCSAHNRRRRGDGRAERSEDLELVQPVEDRGERLRIRLRATNRLEVAARHLGERDLNFS